MRKLLKNLKNISFDLRVFIIVLIILLNLFLLFNPGIFRTKASYVTVKAKKRQLKDINNNIIKGTKTNTDMTLEIADLREQDSDLEKRAMINKKEIDPNGLEFHLPSVLIRLEDSSKENDLSIAIKYNEISYQDIQGKELDIGSLENQPKPEENQEGIEENKVSSLEEEIEKEENKRAKNLTNNVLLGNPKETNTKNLAKTDFGDFEDELRNLDQEENNNINEPGQLPSNLNDDGNKNNEKKEEPNNQNNNVNKENQDIMTKENIKRFKEEGVDVTQIPVAIKGSYGGVKKFVKDLDKLNYLEPTKVEIKSLGQTVEAKITISIFHGDIFR